MKAQEHLTSQQLSGYVNDSLDAEENNYVGRYLLICEECRKLLPHPRKNNF